MEKETLKVSQDEWKQFEMDLRTAAMGANEMIEKVQLVLLNRLLQAENKITRLKKTL